MSKLFNFKKISEAVISDIKSTVYNDIYIHLYNEIDRFHYVKAKLTIIKFTFNEQFKTLVKDLGGKWVPTKKGWLFSINQRPIIFYNFFV